MSGAPILSVVVPVTGLPDRLHTCLWSILRQSGVALEVILVGGRTAGLPGRVAREFVRADHRVRILETSELPGPETARRLGLAAARGTYVTFAEADGLAADGAYAGLVELLQRSGSDFAVGSHEVFTDKGVPTPTQGTDLDLAEPVTAARPSDRPGVVVGPCLAARVFRRSFLTSEVMSAQAARPEPDELFLVRAFSAARAIDVAAGPMFFRRQPENPAGFAPLTWALAASAGLDLLASAGHATARGRFAEHLLTELRSHLTALPAAVTELAPAYSALVRSALAALPPGSLARLPVRARWQLAILALGQLRLLPLLEPSASAATTSVDTTALEAPLPHALTSVLGLGEDSLEVAFRHRFVEPRPPQAEVAATDDGPPEISVVIPTHDVEEYLDELLSSVRAAAGVRLEIVVVDDHSTDRTWEIAERHAREDSRIRLHRSPHRGGGHARNVGVAAAVGEWLCFADGDDIVPADAYAALLEAARRTDAEIVTGSYQKFGDGWVWDGGELFGYDLELDGIDVSRHPRLLTHRVCWNRLIRREFWLSRRLEFPNVARANDILPITRALLAARRISVAPVLSYRYRTRPGAGSMTAAQGSEAATLSYLAQETEAAKLIAQAAEPHVQDEYWSVILPQDCWRHVRSHLLASSTTEPGPDSAAAVPPALARLLESAPETAQRMLAPVQKAIYALVIAHRPREAAALLSTTNRTGRLTRPEALELPDAIAVIDALASTEALPTADLSPLATALLLPALSGSRGTVTPGTAQSLRSLTGELAGIGVTLTPPPGSEKERLTRAAQHGTAEQLLEVLSAEPAPVPATLRRRPTHARLEIATDPAHGELLWLLAARKLDGRPIQFPVGSSRLGARRSPRQFRLRAGDLPRGGSWRLSLRWADQWGLRTSPLAIRDGTRLRLAVRLGRFVVPVAGGPRVRLTPSLASRVRRLARTLLPRRR